MSMCSRDSRALLDGRAAHLGESCVCVKGSKHPGLYSILAPQLLKCLQLGSLKINEGQLTGGGPASSCHFWGWGLPCAHTRIQGQISVVAGYAV